MGPDIGLELSAFRIVGQNTQDKPVSLWICKIDLTDFLYEPEACLLR